MNRDRDFVAYATAGAHRLRRTAYLLCGNWHTAEDLTQVALTKLYVAWPRLERREAIDGYARQVVVRVYLDERRRASSGEVPMAAPPDSAATSPLSDERMDLMTALAQLPERQRAVLVLRFFEDLDVSTVADVLGCSEGTVKSATSRALAALRALLPNADVDLSVEEVA